MVPFAAVRLRIDCVDEHDHLLHQSHNLFAVDNDLIFLPDNLRFSSVTEGWLSDMDFINPFNDQKIDL